MFGFQRVGDMIWAACDARARGFLIGGTAGRTTLAGEGLQHQDGNSHMMAYPYPNLMAYDPAFAFEIAVILEEGFRRMYVEGEDLIYYLTVGNELYAMPPMPEGSKEGIIKGMYRFKESKMKKQHGMYANLMGSGAIMNEALQAAQILENDFGVACDVYSVTSYKQLHRNGAECDRHDMHHPEEARKTPYVAELLNGFGDVTVAASDYVKALPYSIAQWIPTPFLALGTDGFGRSDGRRALRDFFEVDDRHIVVATLVELMRAGKMDLEIVKKAADRFGIDANRVDPVSR